MRPATLFCFAVAFSLASFLCHPGDLERYEWQKAEAVVDPKGDLAWAPQGFEFKVGANVRYIDFENGSDDNDGLGKSTPWKHHPWDAAAKGKASACSGADTFVFKGGSRYRGSISVRASGSPSAPLRFTCDPSWGSGKAQLCGSRRVEGWVKGASNALIPDQSDVWQADLDFLPRNLWMENPDGTCMRVPLARIPKWKEGPQDDVKSGWWHWDNAKVKPFGNETSDPKFGKMNFAVDSEHVKGSPDYFLDAIVRSEWGWVMGTPYPVRVKVADMEKSGLGFYGPWGDSSGGKSAMTINHNRYFLEDKPQYLSDPEGEFWFERKGAGGRLYLIPPGGGDPNKMHVEAAKEACLIEAKLMENVEISNLAFIYENVGWELEERDAIAFGKANDACIKLRGSAKGLLIANCLFKDIVKGVRLYAAAPSDSIDTVVIRDNQFASTDDQAVLVHDGALWGKSDPAIGRVYDVKVLRNRFSDIGRRPGRGSHGHALELASPETCEVSGNVLERCYASGIMVWGGKISGMGGERPFARLVIHHNKVTDSLLNSNDWGGIETWQGGPAYVYCNISGNPGGYMNYNFKTQGAKKPGVARFGHAFYLDGAFKNYYFNNIAWGSCNDPRSPLGNCSAFQEIVGYQNVIFNNTVWNFLRGSRRQSPQAGRNQYLGNLFQDISMIVFRHSDVEGKDPNAIHAGKQEGSFDYASGAYSRNVFYGIGDKIGVFDERGGDHSSVEGFAKALAERKCLASDAGSLASKPPLPGASVHDFRPDPGSGVAGHGVKAFVPWSLRAVVGEWHFLKSEESPAAVSDDHWQMKPHMLAREDYFKSPMYPLQGVGIEASSYVDGPLEDWIKGALKLDGRSQYLFLKNFVPEKPREAPSREVSESWFRAVVPSACSPGEQIEIRIDNLKAQDGHTLCLGVNYMKGAAFGGSLRGFQPQKIKGPGPYVFRGQAPDAGGLMKSTPCLRKSSRHSNKWLTLLAMRSNL